jgi:formate hydrogenlyase subunit 3/multisubunit Na+/H+ antiporter MnhD subunit
MQRLGDVAFLAAAVVAYSFYGTLDLQQLARRAAAMPSFVTLWPGGFSIQGGT